MIGNLRLAAISDPVGAVALPQEVSSVLRKPEGKRNAKETGRLKAYFLKSNVRFLTLEKRFRKI